MTAYSFVLAREQEYEADRFASRVAGKEEMGRALVAMEVQGARLARGYWPVLFRQAAVQPDPPAGVFQSLRDTVRAPYAVEDRKRWLGAALNRRTGNEDTHPSLADRLKALGVAPPSRDAALRGPSGVTAADRCLGTALPDLVDRVEALWREAVKPGWRAKHQADARGRVHRLGHVLDQADELGVHLPDGLGPYLQDRRGILQDGAEGHQEADPRLRLGSEAEASV